MDEVWQWSGAAGGLIWVSLALYGLTALLMEAVRFLRELRTGRRTPALSVLVLIKNQEEYLEEIVERLEQQPWGEELQWELILVDLDSTDASPQILSRLSRERVHGKVVHFPSQAHHHICDAAVFLCRHPLVLLVDLRLPGSGPKVLQSLANNWK